MKKQFRFTKAGEKFLNTKTLLTITTNYDALLASISPDDVPKAIQILDEHAEDWDISEQCFHYFASVILAGLKEDSKETDSEMKIFGEELKKTVEKLYEAIQ